MGIVMAPPASLTPRMETGFRKIPEIAFRSACAAGLLALVGLFGSFHWLADLTNHFPMQALGAVLTGIAIQLLARRWKAALILSPLLILPLVRVIPCYASPPQLSSIGTDLRVCAFNVLISNPQKNEAVEWVRHCDADLVVLVETDAAWCRAFDALKDLYPHRLAKSRADSFGIHLLSKHPILSHQHRIPPGGLVPLLEAVVSTPAGPVTVYGVHPLPPMSGEAARSRDAYLRHLALDAGKKSGPVILLGDFNATPWSVAMRPLRDAGFVDASNGYGHSATWSRRNPLLAIPIDHILTRGLPPPKSFIIGPDLGSDHRPILADLLLLADA